MSNKKVYTYKKYVEGYEVYNVVAESKEDADRYMEKGLVDMDDFESVYSDAVEFEGECIQQ